MHTLKLSLLSVLGFAGLAFAPASAMPVNDLSQAVQTDVQDARLHCNYRGRCYRTGYRYGYRSYRSYGSYGYAPGYGGYGYGGYGYGGPGVGISIGIGSRYY
jgi:hypothetical protein